jgi:hypothetical protein
MLPVQDQKDRDGTGNLRVGEMDGWAGWEDAGEGNMGQTKSKYGTAACPTSSAIN